MCFPVFPSRKWHIPTPATFAQDVSALMEPAVTNIASKLGVTPAQVLQTLDSPPVAGGAALGRAEGLLCHTKVRKSGEDGCQPGC